MKTKRLITVLSAMAVLLCCSTALVAETRGYALYGDVPTGYDDLTSKVQVVAPAEITGGQNLASTDHVAPAAEGVAFTGRGHSSHYCQGKADLSIRFSENQTLTLTENYAIHIKIKRTTTGSGDIQMSYIKGTWGSVRVGFLMDASKLSDTESEIVLKYADRKQNGGSQYYCNNENQTYGTRTYNGGDGSEIFRMTAANGEAFLITGIYIEASYTEPDPEPEPEPTGEKRYYFFSSREVLPSGDDLTSVDLRNGAGTTIQWNGGMSAPLAAQTTYTSIPVQANWFSFNQNLKTATDMSSLASGGKLVIKMRSNLTGASSSKPMMVRLCNGISYNLYGDTYFDGEWHTHVFDLADAANHPTFNASMSSTIFQFHVNSTIGAGKIDIDFAYLTNDATNLDEGTAFDDATAPTGLTASASEVAQNSLKLTMTATDDSEGQITYVVTYDTDKTKNVKAASGADAEVVIDGLSADTDYSFSIVAKDAAGNTSDPVVVNQRTAKEPLGYALYGVVPADYVDLTSKVTITNNGSTNWDAPTFTGAGTNSIIANIGHYLNVALTEAQTLALTDQFALHIRLKKVSGTNDVQVSLTSGNWNACRAGWLVKNNRISGSDYVDFALCYTKTDATLSYSSEKKQNLLNGVSFSGTILRICAANGEQFDIDQIYIEKIYTDTEAPQNMTLTVKSRTSNEIVVAASAWDVQDQITYTFYNGDAVLGSVNGASGASVDYTVTGLNPNTAYTIGVKAKDSENNETVTKTTIEVTTMGDVSEKRIYLLGDPSAIDCNISYGNSAHQDARISNYYSVKAGNDTWTSVTFKPKADVENEINDDWYIVMRFRSCMDNGAVFGFNNFRVNLSNGAENFYMNSNEWTSYGYGEWRTVKFRIGDAKAGSVKPTEYLRAGQVALQLHVDKNLKKGDYFDIEYIYFTNNASTPQPGVLTGKKLSLGEDRSNAAMLAATEGATFEVDFCRSFEPDGYYTLCLPFSLSAEEVQTYFPGEFSYLVSSELRGSDLIHLNFERSTTIEACRPYLYLPSASVPERFLEDVTINAKASTAIETEYFSMYGIYEPQSLPQDAGIYFLGEGDYLYAVHDNSKMKSTRAYFKIGESAPVGARARVVMAPNTTTDITAAPLNGGVVKRIVNGRLYIQQGERLYDVLGNRH